jgi:16S rRNA (cytosine967-C5)-methyltransferase
VGKAFIPGRPADTPRAVAARVLLERERGNEYTESLLDAALDKAVLSAPDRALCQELVLGCVRWQGALDHLIAARTQGREQMAGPRVLLRTALYQMLWLDRIPPHAAVHETVELAKQLGHLAQSGFINAVLRGYARDLKPTRERLHELRSTQPALGWSHPTWLVDRWRPRLGEDATLKLLEWNNTPAGTFARHNSLRMDAGKLLERWRYDNVEYEFVNRPWLPENLVFRLGSHPPLSRLRTFQAGGFYVQDPSTLLAPLLLDPQPGETVLDLCAAPGGKTTFMAQMMKNEGRIVACDPSQKRLLLVIENCERLGVTCVEPKSQPPPTTLFDRVLVDAPCSNTGVMRRRVDLRWRLRPEEIERLVTTQLQLLRQAGQLVKPSGCVVYSTCSLESEENGDLVRRFLAEAGGFELEDEQQVTPFADGVDGAYAASLKRKR